MTDSTIRTAVKACLRMRQLPGYTHDALKLGGDEHGVFVLRLTMFLWDATRLGVLQR